VTLPSPLRRGSLIAVVSPSGPIANPEQFQAGIDALHPYDCEVEVVGQLSPRSASAYLSAPDQSRAKSLRNALRASDAVWYSRGGYGSSRLLTSSGWDHVGPWVIGFSDATALLWARYARGISGGIHGPVVNAMSTEPTASKQRLMAILQHQPTEPLPLTHLGGPTSPVTGPVIAGNLAVASTLIGTPFMPNLAGHILVLEDVGELPYKVDRMLTHWHLAGVLDGVAAIVFGTFDAVPNPQTYEVLVERTDSLGVPVYACPSIGHHGECSALVIGRSMRIARNKLFDHVTSSRSR
jgi:muramoyltetrapeptide carboxypeptidase